MLPVVSRVLSTFSRCQSNQNKCSFCNFVEVVYRNPASLTCNPHKENTDNEAMRGKIERRIIQFSEPVDLVRKVLLRWRCNLKFITKRMQSVKCTHAYILTNILFSPSPSPINAGEFASAIETLVTAISIIKQSKIANDDRCKVVISSLQDCLHGIESKSYGASTG